MRCIFLFLLMFITKSTVLAQSDIKVLRVRSGKVLFQGKPVKKGDIITLYKNYPLPPRPRKDFFLKNDIVIAPGGLMKVLYKNRIRVLDFNAFRGSGAKKMPKKNANCLSRDGVVFHDCDNELTNEMFFQRSILAQQILFSSDSCFRYYFNAPTYWQYGNDTLRFASQQQSIQEIILEVGKKCFRIKRLENGSFVIPYRKLPTEGPMKIYWNHRQSDRLVGEPYFVNLYKLFQKCQKGGLNEEECLMIMRNHYLEVGRDMDTKRIVDQLTSLIHEHYQSNEI